MSEANNKDPMQNLLEILIKRKYLILIGFISVFFVIVLTVLKLPPSYQALARIYVGTPSMPSKVDVPYINEYKARSFIGNQKIIITSRTVLERVVRKLRLHEYKAKPSIKFKIKRKIYKILDIEIKESDPFEDAIIYLMENISVYVKRGTNIFSIEASSESPLNAAVLANTVAETYIEYTNSSILSKSKNAYDYIEDKVAAAKITLIKNEEAMNQYKEKELVGTEETKKKVIDTKIAEIDEKLVRVRTEIEEFKRKIANINDNNRKTFISEEDRKRLEKIESMREELSRLREVYTEEHPDVKLLISKIDRLEKDNTMFEKNSKSKENINNSDKENNYLLRLGVVEKNLKAQKRRLDAERRLIAKKEIEYAKLVREYVESRDEHRALEERFERVHILSEDKAISSDLRIIDSAFAPAYANNKKKKVIIVIGFMASLIFGLGIAFVAEFIDTAIRGPEEIQDVFGIDVLGEVPVINRRTLKCC